MWKYHKNTETQAEIQSQNPKKIKKIKTNEKIKKNNKKKKK